MAEVVHTPVSVDSCWQRITPCAPLSDVQSPAQGLPDRSCPEDVNCGVRRIAAQQNNNEDVSRHWKPQDSRTCGHLLYKGVATRALVLQLGPVPVVCDEWCLATDAGKAFPRGLELLCCEEVSFSAVIHDGLFQHEHQRM
jgi:hypothetical protein